MQNKTMDLDTLLVDQALLDEHQETLDVFDYMDMVQDQEQQWGEPHWR